MEPVQEQMEEVIFCMTYGKPSSWLCDVTLISIICFLLFFWGMGAKPFMDKQEPREALVIWEINNTGNWILPLRNGTEIPDKPPLFHWLGALASKTLNRVDELSTRFPSALLGTLGVLLTYLAAVNLWGRTAGLVSALVLSTSFEWWQAATSARLDMTLSFVMLCAFLFFLYFYRTGGGRKKALIFGFLLGLATLTKGPLGFVVPSLTVFIFLWIRGDLPFLKRLHPFIAISLCAIVAGSWYALALRQHGMPFILEHIRENTRMGENAPHPQPFFFYIRTLFLHMAPWSIFLFPVGAFLYYYRQRLTEEKLLYVVVWIVTVFAFFSVFTSKRPVYILPLYPAAALLIGAWWQKLKDEQLSSHLFLARLAGYLNAAAFLITAGILLCQFMGLDPLKYARLLLGSKDQEMLVLVANLLTEHHVMVLFWSALCALGGVFLMLALMRDAWETVIGCIAAVMVTSLFFLQTFDIYLSKEYSLKSFMESVLPVVDGAPLFFYRSADYGVILYAGRHIPVYRESLQGKKSPFYLLLWEEEWKQIPNKEGLSLLRTSESRDRTGGRGRLFLVSVAA